MKKYFSSFSILCMAVTLVLWSITSAFSRVEWEVLDNVPVKCKPLDIAMSSDGASAYILCRDKIQLLSIRENKITDSIPVKGNFSRIAITSDSKKLFLTDAKQNQVSVIQVSHIFDIAAGNSPVIGNPDAKVSVVAFIDFQ